LNVSIGHPFINLMKDQVRDTLKTILTKKQEDAPNA